jgi:hypothetical protein
MKVTEGETSVTDLTKQSDIVKPKIDIGYALKLRLHNKLSYTEIGKKLGCSRAYISKSLKPFKKFLANPEALSAYENEKGKLLQGAEMVLLSNIVDNDKIKKASINNIAYAFNTISQQGHIARGEATANVNYHVMTENLNELERELEKIESELES